MSDEEYSSESEFDPEEMEDGEDDFSGEEGEEGGYPGGAQPIEFTTFWTGKVEPKDECQWTVPEEAEENPCYLHLRNIALGPDAKGPHVLQATVIPDINSGVSEMVTFVIATLVPGRTEQVQVDLCFDSEVTFSLLKGDSPLHLAGHVRLVDFSEGEGYPFDEAEEGSDEESEEEEDMSEEESEEEEAPKLVPAGKRPALGNGNPAATKKAKLTKKIAESEEDEEESEDESEDEPKTKKPVTAPAKTPTKKADAPAPAAAAKTPAKDAPKTPAKDAPKTPKASEGESSAEVSEVMKKILASPNRPKKEDKFNNYVKNTFKINDDALLNKLWSSYKKSQNI